MRNVLLLPKWMTALKWYSDTGDDFHTCSGKLDSRAFSADHVVGLSLGALIALRDIQNIKGKIILINPPVPKRSIARWFVQWVKFVTNEGLFLEINKFTINPMRYILGLVDCITLLTIDFSNILDSVSKDKVIVIRGKQDTFFCDASAVSFLRQKNIEIIETEGGHNWSKGIEEILDNLLRK